MKCVKSLEGVLTFSVISRFFVRKGVHDGTGKQDGRGKPGEAGKQGSGRPGEA